MTTQEIKSYLEKELPDFTYIDGKETPHEENWSSILVSREGKGITLDVTKVDNQEALEKLKAFITDMWNRQ